MTRNKKKSSNKEEENLEIHYSLGGFKTLGDLLREAKKEIEEPKIDNEELFMEFMMECNHDILLKEIRKLRGEKNDEE